MSFHSREINKNCCYRKFSKFAVLLTQFCVFWFVSLYVKFLGVLIQSNRFATTPTHPLPLHSSTLESRNHKLLGRPKTSTSVTFTISRLQDIRKCWNGTRFQITDWFGRDIQTEITTHLVVKFTGCCSKLQKGAGILAGVSILFSCYTYVLLYIFIQSLVHTYVHTFSSTMVLFALKLPTPLILLHWQQVTESFNSWKILLQKRRNERKRMATFFPVDLQLSTKLVFSCSVNPCPSFLPVTFAVRFVCHNKLTCVTVQLHV